MPGSNGMAAAQETELEATRPTYALTDAGNAELFALRSQYGLRFVHGWDRWLVDDGARWAPDERQERYRRAIETARSRHSEAADAESEVEARAISKHALQSEKRERIEAMLALARSQPQLATIPSELDHDPDLFNVPNGTLDLRTFRLERHDRAHLITKCAPVPFDPEAQAPVWLAMLERTLPTEDVRGYVQRAVGYSLTGNVGEHCLFFCYGTGANGKSTLLETLRELLGEGEYAKAAQPDLLLAKKQERHSVELADLRGMRFVTTVEAGEGRAWDEVRVKWLTGGDTISARLMYGNPFSFEPTHKFWIAANHRPRVSGTDLGFWRRVHLIPWTVTIPEAERDLELRAKLRQELPGILRWAVDGARDWRRAGLRPPARVVAATAEYRCGEDVLGAFIEEKTVEGDRVDQPALYAVYRGWAERSGERPVAARAFGEALEERGFTRSRSHGRTWIGGLELRSQEGT